MNYLLPFSPPPLPHSIRYTDNILLVGSCFTEHIAGRLQAHKFHVLQNPNGVLFNPNSVAESLKSYIQCKEYALNDLFYLNEVWNSWDHHSLFSHINKEEALDAINASQKDASAFISSANWVIITLGSSFQYFLKEGNKPVANNHRAPAQWFEKRLLDIDTIVSSLSSMADLLFAANSKVNILFTISPVRHTRDGAVDNNRSKARLIEAVHQLCSTFSRCHYFPSYEIVIDILRDYRFYDVDMVHPNYATTETVWEYFTQSCIDPAALPIMSRVKDIMIAKSHRPRFPQTLSHQKFMHSYLEKVKALKMDAPYLDLVPELAYFTQNA